jgi:hypothetical protein
LDGDVEEEDAGIVIAWCFDVQIRRYGYDWMMYDNDGTIHMME